MQINNVSLAAVGVSFAQYPSDERPEVAFIGRSNVGKSSAINALMNRKSLARTSSAPGKTRTINFYNIEDILYFVDLPGYGYAKISKKEKERWGRIIEGYLVNREQLKKIILLVDIRHDTSENDKLMYDFIKHYQIPVLVVATKFDKLNRNEVSKKVSAIRKGLDLQETDKLICFSSKTKEGKDDILNEIENVVNTEISS